MKNSSEWMARGTRQCPRVVSRILFALVLSTGTASAVVLPDDAVPERVLAGLRGGLEVASLKIDLAANLRTYIDDRLTLETTVHLERYADRHRWVEQRVTAHEVGSASDDSIASPASHPTVTTRTVNDEVVQIVVPVSDANGVGSTRVSHRIGPEQLFSTVANTADGRSVQQIMDVELRVLNFRSYSGQIHNALRARQMGKAIAR